MRKPKIFLETTVFNHYFDTDREAHAATVKLFKEIQADKYDAYTSAYVVEELEDAKEPKRSNMLALILECNIKVLGVEYERIFQAPISMKPVIATIYGDF